MTNQMSQSQGPSTILKLRIAAHQMGETYIHTLTSDGSAYLFPMYTTDAGECAQQHPTLGKRERSQYN